MLKDLQKNEFFKKNITTLVCILKSYLGFLVKLRKKHENLLDFFGLSNGFFNTLGVLSSEQKMSFV